MLSLRDQRENYNARDRIKVYNDAKRAHVLKERDQRRSQVSLVGGADRIPGGE